MKKVKPTIFSAAREGNTADLQMIFDQVEPAPVDPNSISHYFK